MKKIIAAIFLLFFFISCKTPSAVSTHKTGTISASANVNAAALLAVYEAHVTKSGDADVLQAKIAAVRKVFQSPAMIPLLKGIVAHYRKDKSWARVRPPLTALPAADVAAAIKVLEAEHSFRMSFDA